MSEPKIDMKVGTKDEALWTAVKNAQEEKIKDLENQLIVGREVLKLAILKILSEEKK